MDEEEERRMRNTFGGYDWGDPIQLWTTEAPKHTFTPAELAIAERVFARAA
jgi:hypothetical protein